MQDHFSDPKPMNVMSFYIYPYVQEIINAYIAGLFYSFVTYGSLQLGNILSALNTLILSECSEVSPCVDQIAWPKAQPSIAASIDIECSKDELSFDPDRPLTFCRSFSIGRQTDAWTCFLMQLLDLLIFNCESSFLYQRLIASGLASGFLAQSGYDDNTNMASFHIGLQGVSDIAKVQQELDKALDETVKCGFNCEDIQSSLHKIELSALHVSGSFGTHISIGAVASWLNGLNIAEELSITNKVKRLREELKANPDILVNKLKETITENSLRKELIMRPSKSFAKRTKENDINCVNAKVIDIGLQNLKIMQNDISIMKANQSKKEDASCLPKLSVSDITAEAKDYQYRRTVFTGAIPGFIFPQQTNHLIYLRHMSSFEIKSSNILPYLPLFSDIYSRLGTKKFPYWKLSRAISSISSGIHLSPHLVIHPTDIDKFELGTQISSFFIPKNMDLTLELWNEILHDFRDMLFQDDDRLKVLIREAALDAVNSLTSNGHLYAKLRAKSNLGYPIAQISDNMFGLNQIEFLQNLRNKEDLNAVRDAISNIYDHMIAGKQRISVHHDLRDLSSDVYLEKVDKKWANGFQAASGNYDLPYWQKANSNDEKSGHRRDLEYYHIEADVNYCATAFKLNSTSISIRDKAA
ncbi:hypothetical protein GJ496_010435 [Pomphorhynchus laevis]|nr:hypothetical protein GJ496_010435 [Pomphorhynchus laevis]